MDETTALLARIEVLERESAQMRARIEDWERVSQIFRQPLPSQGPPLLTLVRPA